MEDDLEEAMSFSGGGERTRKGVDDWEVLEKSEGFGIGRVSRKRWGPIWRVRRGFRGLVDKELARTEVGKVVM